MTTLTAMPVLYPRATEPELDLELFREPSAEYRGAPFWSWNTALDRAQLERQIEVFKRMGFGGYHMHARTGLATPYLSDAFMAMVRACVAKGESLGMLSWLYDEDRWPSGFAGGLVTREPRFRMRQLLFTARPYDNQRQEGVNISGARTRRYGNGTLLARYHVALRDGRLHAYRRLADDEPAPTNGVWYAYLEVAEPTAWFNHQTYVDTLNRAAIERFIEVTHKRYAEAVGGSFGRSVPAIFTDEPQFVHKQTLRRAEEPGDVLLPFTDDLCETYAQAYGQRLEDHLPELVWELPDGRASVARYRYHDHVAERFASAFADTIGQWCGEHGLALTGHMMEEPTLHSQTGALGEAMRSYRAFHLPGIDILCDRHEYTTAKQAQSAAHQYGRPGTMSELYGVTDWDFDFAGFKRQGDWQAALGVTVRVPHLSWVSMAGEAKRDYPPSIFYQSPWWEHWPLPEDHFARVNVALVRGRPRVRVGVVHPIESYWLCFGPQDQTQLEREERDGAFKALTEWLLMGLIDFDFICESLLPSQGEVREAPQLTVGQMAYDAVVVPGMRTIRGTTLDRLEAMASAGGTVIFAGEVPTLVDAEPSDRAQQLAARCVTVPFNRPGLLEALEPWREVDIRQPDGMRTSDLIHQLRIDGDGRTLFVANTSHDATFSDATVSVAGTWSVTEPGHNDRRPAADGGGARR